MGLSPEEIAKVKEEWEERQRQKKKAEKEKAKEKEKEKEKDKVNEKEKEKEKEKVKVSDSSMVDRGETNPVPPTPTHQRYTLHRDFFAMRLSEHRQRKRVAQAKELAPRLPATPRGNIPG
jgi:AAA-ATPase Vps4-associated protein 1